MERKNSKDMKNMKKSDKRHQNVSLFFNVMFIGIFLLAVFLRFYLLDMRVFHHDESAIGFGTYQLFRFGIYSYDPAFHGPFMYYTTSEMFRLFGDSDHTARLLPAFFGSVMLFLLVPLRRYIGTTGTLITTFFLAISPSFLYYSRFFREDIIITFFTLLIFVCAVKYYEKYSEEKHSYLRLFYIFSGAVALGSIAALKENAFIVMLLIILYLVLLFFKEKWYEDLIVKIRNKKAAIVISEVFFFIIVFLMVFSLYYTDEFLDIQGLKNTVEKAVSYWYGTHKIARLGGSPFYYVQILVQYELPILIFGLIGIIHHFKKKNVFFSFFSYWAISNFIVYSYLQEKVPWLILNPLLPLTLIAGSFIGELLPKLDLNKKTGVIVVVLLIAASAYLIYSSILLNFYNYADTKEPLIQGNQVPQRFKEENLPDLYEWASELDGKPAKIELHDIQVTTTFLWYLRHYENITIYYSVE